MRLRFEKLTHSILWFQFGKKRYSQIAGLWISGYHFSAVRGIEKLGHTAYVIMCGLDENMDAVGYAIVMKTF